MLVKCWSELKYSKVCKTDFIINTELNDLRISICLRKSEITVCNVIEKLMEYAILSYQ